MIRFLSQITPFPFYTYIKQIFEHQESSLTGPSRVHLLECGALTLFILRFSLLQLAINFGLTSYLSWDPLAQYMVHYRHLYGGYTLLCLAWLGLYALVINWLFFIKTSEYTSSAISWQAMAYDLIVRNADQAQLCIIERPKIDRFARLVYQSIKANQGITKSGFKFSPFNSFLGFLTDKLSLNHLDLAKLSHSDYQLSIFSFLSVKHRKKILQFHILSSVVSRIFQGISFTPILLGILLQLLLVVPVVYPKTMSIFGWILLFNDLLLISTFGWLLFRNVLIFVYLQTLPSVAYRWHLQTVHRLLIYLSVKYRSTFTQNLTHWDRLLLRNLLAEHAHICALLDDTNRQHTRQAVFAACLCNAPTNIYLIYRLIYKEILLSELAINLLFTASQILCLCCAFIPLAQANGALYRTGKYLSGVQLYVLRGGNCRSLKIKYEILQSTLSESRVKSGATIGPICLLTFESLYKVVTV